MTDLHDAVLDVHFAITFRTATLDDLPRLEWYGQYKHYRNVFRRTFREQQLGRRLMLLADCSGFPIGQIFIQFTSNNSQIADGRQRGYLYSLRVMEMFRQQGIGTRLIQEAEAVLIERGFHQVTIAVSLTNDRARRLYERLGYRVSWQDSGNWSYIDHLGRKQQVHDPCWLLEKSLKSR